ncbi:unnamed protein product [Absidia cylindrospora]
METNDVCSTCDHDSPQDQHELQHPLVQKDFMPTFYNPFETKHRRRTSRAQFKILETSFLENTKPNATMRRWLAQKLDMTPRSVQVWFQNRRAKAKSQLHSRHPPPSSPSSSPSSSSSTLTSHCFETPLQCHTDDMMEQQNIWPTFVNPTMDDNYCQQQQPLNSYPPHFSDASELQWQQQQQQQQQQMTYDPLSMLMDSPDLISWCSSSPISSPLPSLLSPNTSNQQHHVDPATFQIYSPQSSPPSYRRSSFPINFDIQVDPMEKDALRRLSEPIFDLQSQSQSATPFPYAMMNLQQQPHQQYPTSTFNDYSL